MAGLDSTRHGGCTAAGGILNVMHGQQSTAGADDGMKLAVPHVAQTAPVLALGAYFKSAPCLLRDGEALFGANAGDLDSPEACVRLERAVDGLLALSDELPVAIAHDLHPDFHSSRIAVALAGRLGVPALAVQHHHAHVESVLVENGYSTAASGPVLGLALDGVGLGDDGQAWGGELLAVHGARFSRLGHLRVLPLAGGDRAAREPWRMASAVLHLLGRGEEIATRFAARGASAHLAKVLARPHLCQHTSSLGRWFDAAAGMLGLCEVMHAEAEAAIALEAAAASHGVTDADEGDWRLGPDGQLDLLPVFRVLADEADPARGAARFHAALITGLAAWVSHAAKGNFDSRPFGTVVFSGGCFANRILSAGLGERLRDAGIEVLQARRLSPGDAAIALGQAHVAAMEHAAGANPRRELQGA